MGVGVVCKALSGSAVLVTGYLQYQKVTEKAKGYLFEKVRIHQ